MPAGEPIRLGPFVGGINHLSDPTALQDNELVDVINYDLDLDGSYISRPPIFNYNPPVSGSIRMKLLGWFQTATFSRLIGCNNVGLWYFELNNWTFITGTSNLLSTAMVQYDNTLYVVATPNSVADGGTINSSMTFTTVAAIPRGGSAVVHKERLYIVPGPEGTGSASTLLKFSDAANFSSWPGSNQVYVNKGDGEKLIDVVVYNDNLLLFKEDSTYGLAFDTTPTDAIMRKINSTIGTSSKDCVVPYENQLYVLHRDSVYEIVNFDFGKINSKVPFVLDTTKPSPWADSLFLTILGNRLVVKYYARYYVFGLRTRVWTRWEIDSKYPGPAMKVPSRGEDTAIPTFIMGSAIASETLIYGFRDVYDNENTEDIDCTIVTKNYDHGVPHRYKKLVWWGSDMSSVAAIVGILQPIVVSFEVTWGDLFTKTWGELVGNTWGQPLSVPLIIQTTAPANPAFRKFIKFPKTIRFRQINYKLTTSYDGTALTGPVRFFTITTIISTKEHVSKQLT